MLKKIDSLCLKICHADTILATGWQWSVTCGSDEEDVSWSCERERSQLFQAQPEGQDKQKDICVSIMTPKHNQK